MLRHKVCALIALGMGLLGPRTGSNATTPFFIGTGIKPNAPGVNSMSSDGRFIVGDDFRGPRNQTPNNFFLNNYIVRWTDESEPLVLDINGHAGGVSDDGSVIVGSEYASDELPLIQRAYRWTETDGIQYLATGHATSVSSDVSEDGNTIVGDVSSNIDNPSQDIFRWTVSDGLQVLGRLPGSTNMYSSSVSNDGSVVVGTSYFSTNATRRAFRWTQNDGLSELGTPPSGTRDYAAFGGTPDLSVVVGYLSEVQYVQVPAYWSEATGWVAIPDLDGGNTITFGPVYARAVSADGSIIVGRGVDESGPEPFIWDAIHGTRNLTSVLRDEYALADALAGWNLTQANGISADGRIITGSGRNPLGVPEYWIAYLGSDIDPIDGDFNTDGIVDASDYVVWRNLSGQAGAGLAADGNSDGVVDQDDYVVWRASFGHTAPSATNTFSGRSVNITVPEPATLAIATLLLAHFTARQRRRRRKHSVEP
jgi:probable HAF family extracellular repeat protein